jgi:hypothetical protein
MKKKEWNMSNEKEGQKNYVYRVLDDTNNYFQELLRENEELRLSFDAIKNEKNQIEEQLLLTQNELKRSREDKSHLEQKLTQIEGENRQYSGRYIEVEQQNANLANLYVASFRLHATLDREEVLTVIQEIIINLIGSEELAIFEVDASHTALQLVASYGINEEKYRSVPFDQGIIGTVATSGQPYLAKHEPDEEAASSEPDLTACLPLRLGESITGAIAIFHLLPQKQSLEPLDYELFDLLGTHAAAALYCTGLEAKLRASLEVSQ